MDKPCGLKLKSHKEPSVEGPLETIGSPNGFPEVQVLHAKGRILVLVNSNLMSVVKDVEKVAANPESLALP